MKKIKLSLGKNAFVDDEDFEYLKQFRWHAKDKRGVFYAAGRIRVNGKQVLAYMHRVVLKAEAGQFVDHKDGNPLNNQKSNLRFCTRSENMMNRRRRCKGASKYKGVCFNKEAKKWAASLSINNKNIFLGYFLKEDDAAQAYDRKAKELYGDFANLNFGK